MQSTCEYKTWSVIQLSQKINQGQIKLPKFQRGVSWNLERQKKLIGSIRQGFPIGALLLYKTESNAEGADIYSIIDGLQRTTAIRRYLQNQTGFLGNSDSDILPEWREFGQWVLSTFTGLSITDALVNDFIHGYISSQKLDSIDRLDFYNLVVQRDPEVDLQILNDSQQLKDRFSSFSASVKQSLDISSASVPVIVFEGDESLLPEIFERLNSQGVPLNKYQIFAASWQDKCRIENTEILTSIKSFYSSRMEDASFEIEDIEDDGLPEQLTLFDYLTGLGAVLTTKHPSLFDASWADYVAFQIATVAHGLQIGSMRQLPMQFRKNESDEIITEQFTDAVLATCQEVAAALSGRLSLKLNSSSEAEFSGHSAFLIDTIVTRLLIDRFEPISWHPKQTTFPNLNMAQTVRRWYLIDRIKDVWGNAGDSQFFRQVWDKPDELGPHVPAVSTVTANTTDELKSVLDSWFADQLKRREKSRKNVTRETKLLLRYFYYNVLSVGDENENYFHIDHLVPISWWSSFFKKFPDSAGPINSIGNLCLMISADNTHKKKKLPLEWFTERSASGDDPQFVGRCKDKYFLIAESELGYPGLAGSLNSLESSNHAVRDAVVGGLMATSSKRWSRICQGIVESLAD